MRLVDLAVQGLGRPGYRASFVRHLAWVYAHHPVIELHYDAIAATLVETLEECFGAGFTAPVKAAWTAFLVELSSRVRDAAVAVLLRHALAAPRAGSMEAA